MIRASLLTFLLICYASAFGVEISPNSVYRIKNNSGRYMATSGTKVVTMADAIANENQQWFFVYDESKQGYYLRNVQSGGYLESPLATSSQWKVTFTTQPTSDNMLMTFIDYNNMVVFCPKAHNSGSNYAHNDGYNNVVCWGMGSTNSSWVLDKIDKTEDELRAIEERFKRNADEIANASTYEKHLANLFEDGACSVLKQGITLDGNDDFEALSTPLKAMVKKISGGDWKETNVYKDATAEWNDSYARKYRVQYYEPYSEGHDAAGYLAYVWAYTNMNNPTGIVGDKGDLIYIMVEDDIKEGSTLYIGEVPDEQMYNSPTAGNKLHKGLNIITCDNDNSHFFIYYTVTTTNANRDRLHNLKDYEPIKIHIEGGRINGFFNYLGDDLYAKDKKEDFEYTVQRATHPMYDFVGDYIILHLHLFDTPSQPGGEAQRCVKTSMFTDRKENDPNREYDPAVILKAWDNMCFSELMLMGLLGKEDIENPYNQGLYESIVGENYSMEVGGKTFKADPGFVYREYFNNKNMGISQQGSLFMNASAWRTAFNVSTIDAILSQFCNGEIWGPAHEYGHMNQLPINMAGTTEESNNIFSNVAVYYVGKKTSRSDFISSQLNVFLNNQTFLKNGTWGTTRMFWQLWMYYHLTGHNKKFYPRLFELLRNNQLKKTNINNGIHYEKGDMLHFAKMCCIAAQEDLTNFFTAWGFFVPLNDFRISDYSEYNAVLTQKDIDEWKAEIKALNLPKNESIIFIDDRPGNSKQSFDGFPKEKAGEFGGLSDFNENISASGDFSFTINGNTVTATGNGKPGVGFIVRDENGELLGFANSLTFTLSSEVVFKLAHGSASILTIGADGSSAKVENKIIEGSISDKRAILKTILAQFKSQVINYIDATGNRLGYLSPGEETAKLSALASSAQAILDNESATSDEITKIIVQLLEAEVSTPSNEMIHRNKLEEGAAYKITSLHSGKVIATGDGSSINSYSNSNDANRLWVISPDDKGNYTLRNYDYEFSKFITHPENATAGSNVTLSAEGSSFTLRPIEGKIGEFALLVEDDENTAIVVPSSNQDTNIYFGRLTDGTFAHWSLTKINDPEYVDQHYRLGKIIAKASDLFYMEDFWDLDNCMTIYKLCEDGSTVYKSQTSTVDQLAQYADDLENSISYAMALLSKAQIIVFDSAQPANDMIDDTDDPNAIRQAFNNADQNIFKNIITLQTPVDAANIRAEVTPVKIHSWKSLRRSTVDIEEEYRNAFEDLDTDETFNEFFSEIDKGLIDGFYSGASASLEEGSADGMYNLVLDVPCSGLYNIKLYSKTDDMAIFDSENKIPSFTVEIYPNLVADFGNIFGVNINGYSFKDDDDAHIKTLLVHDEYVEKNDLSNCRIYFPGLYFADSFTASWADSANALSNQNSPCYATVNLNALKDNNGGKINVTASKNGASANYSFYVKAVPEDELASIIEASKDSDSDEYYFNLQGIKVASPSNGIYIIVKDNKANKILMGR